MRVTAEVRWFWENAPPSPFRDWFIEAGSSWPEAGPEARRVDRYLRDEDQQMLGIKTRGSGRRVEIKGMLAQLPDLAELAGCSCRLGLWAKWSSRVLTLDGYPVLRVDKRRRSRRFDLLAAGVAVERTGSRRESPSTRGCYIELTTLSAPDHSPWWTLGFEAFGTLDDVQASLLATADALARRDPPPLPPGDACSYPAWLVGFNDSAIA